MLLEQKNVDVNSRDDAGKNPLHTACSSIQFEMLQPLIKHGADLEIQDRYTGHTTS